MTLLSGRRRSGGILGLIASLALASATPGCATTNVRALRAYAYEDPNIAVALDRTDDIAALLGDLDLLLTATPYTPGDAWVGKMALSDARADELGKEVRAAAPYDDGEFTVPVVKLYRLHLESVRAEAEDAHDEDEAKYPSLLAALEELGSGAKLAEAWEELRAAVDALDVSGRELALVEARYAGQQLSTVPEDLREAEAKTTAAEKELEAREAVVRRALAAISKAKGGSRPKIAKDGLAAFSVALRIDLESLALMPFVVASLVRSVPTAPQQLAEDLKNRKSLAAVTQLLELPAYATSIKLRLERQLQITETLVDALRTLTGTELEETAGFQLEASAVDQIVGITLDSFHAKLDVDGEALFYSQLTGDTDETVTTDNEGNSHKKSLRGRTKRIAYTIEPIWLVGVNLNVGFDAIKLPEAANLDLGFSTDRVFSGGGTLEEGSLGNELGLSGVASDVLDAGLGLVGVKSSVVLATFNAGSYDLVQVDPASGSDVALLKEAVPLELAYKQIDVGYDISWLFYERMRSLYIEELTLGYRMANYTLPRMIYELENLEPPESKSTNFVFLREHDEEQYVESLVHMGGFRLRMGPGGTPRFHPFFDLAAYFGGGPAAFELQDEDFAGGGYGISVVGALGLRARLTPTQFPVMAHAGLLYEMNLIATGAAVEDSQNSIDFGSSDMFHGVKFHLRGSL